MDKPVVEMTDLIPDNHKHMDALIIGALKGIVSIPIFGTVIIGAWDGYWNSRLEETVDRLTQAIKKMDESKIDKEFIASEKGVDLIHQAIRVRMLSHSRLKARLILGLIVESLHKDRDVRFSTSLKETFLSILDDLADEEIIFFREFREGKYVQKTKSDIYEMDGGKGIFLDSLLSLNLITEEDSWQKHLIMSKRGLEFIAYLELLTEIEV